MVNTKELNRLIEEKGWKKSFLAKSLGVSKSSLSRKIAGKRDFRINEMFMLSEMLNLSAEESKQIFYLT